jgi:hypothetical protein
VINLSINATSGFIAPIRYASQFDMAYQNWGIIGMILYYPIIFGNFLLCIKILEYGLESGWSDSTIFFLYLSAMFIPLMIGIPAILTLQRMVVN